MKFKYALILNMDLACMNLLFNFFLFYTIS